MRAHHDVSKAAARDSAIEMLQLVGIPEPRSRVDAYPHEFSGGMRQRAMIAMALINEPKLLIADEPTTALDVTVQAQILELIERLQNETGTAVIMITHDLGVVAEVTDDIAVMYAGRVVERAPTTELFAAPAASVHVGPAALDPAPRHAARRGARPDRGPAAVADHSARPGCAFHPRCPYVREAHKRIDPKLEPVAGSADHQVACLLRAADARRSVAAAARPATRPRRRAPPCRWETAE